MEGCVAAEKAKAAETVTNMETYAVLVEDLREQLQVCVVYQLNAWLPHQYMTPGHGFQPTPHDTHVCAPVALLSHPLIDVRAPAFAHNIWQSTMGITV